jgi:hypothetical protein
MLKKSRSIAFHVCYDVVRNNNSLSLPVTTSERPRNVKVCSRETEKKL